MLLKKPLFPKGKGGFFVSVGSVGLVLSESSGFLGILKDMPSLDIRKPAQARARLRPSAQMFVVGAIVEVLAIVMLLLGVWVSVGSPSTTMTVFLVCMVLGIIGSAISALLAVVGLFKYRRMTLWNILLLVVSFLFNPMLWLALMAFA